MLTATTDHMIQTTDPKITHKPAKRCSICDREMHHYNTFISGTNQTRVVCWECLGREEKGFNARRDFRRLARSGYIPR
jgi:hypothetical protein